MLLDRPVDVALAAFLLAWLLVAAVCQVPGDVRTWRTSRVDRWVRAHDVLGCVPRWHFFAPRPGTEDIHLLYRDRLPDGRVTRWREVLAPAPPLLVGAIWNPDKRHNKALLDATQELVEVSAMMDGDLDRIQLTVSYLAVLTFVGGLPRPHAPDGTQFLIMRSSGPDRPEGVLLSAMHHADPSPAQRHSAC